jgi:hypothetical protein
MRVFKESPCEGKGWTPAQLRRLRQALVDGHSWWMMALKFGRTEQSIRQKAKELSPGRRLRRSTAPKLGIANHRTFVLATSRPRRTRPN